MRLGKTLIIEEHKYCHKCRDIVNASIYFDEDTGCEWSQCPHCKDIDLEDIEHCEVCGDEFYSQSVRHLCNDCEARVNRILNRAIDQVYDLTGWKVLDIPRDKAIEILSEEMERL